MNMDGKFTSRDIAKGIMSCIYKQIHLICTSEIEDADDVREAAETIQILLAAFNDMYDKRHLWVTKPIDD